MMLGMVEGDRPHGRPAKRCLITDWCGYTLPETIQLALGRHPEESLACQ